MYIMDTYLSLKMVNPTFLEDLSVVTININSLFNHNGSKLNGANLNLYKNSILNISDARISEDKYLLLNKKFNENGNRFFTTISNTHRAGCAILFPQNYIKDVVNIMEDKNEIPRFLCITVVNYLGLKATFTCCYLPANKSNKIKMASIQGLYNCIEQIEAKVYSTRSSGPYGPLLLAPAEGIGGPFGPSLGALRAPTLPALRAPTLPPFGPPPCRLSQCKIVPFLKIVFCNIAPLGDQKNGPT